MSKGIRAILNDPVCLMGKTALCANLVGRSGGRVGRAIRCSPPSASCRALRTASFRPIEDRLLFHFASIVGQRRHPRLCLPLIRFAKAFSSRHVVLQRAPCTDSSGFTSSRVKSQPSQQSSGTLKFSSFSHSHRYSTGTQGHLASLFISRT